MIISAGIFNYFTKILFAHGGERRAGVGLFQAKLSLICSLVLCAVFVQAARYPERATMSTRTFPFPKSLYPPRWVDCLLRGKEGSAPTRKPLKHPRPMVSQGRSLSTLRWGNTRHLGKVRDAKIQTPVPLVFSSHSAMGQAQWFSTLWRVFSQEHNVLSALLQRVPKFSQAKLWRSS